jgi:2,4-dienoyl-CoA reductase-like NADH-dependent reductase (Old Yellow Enzyme family)
MKLFEPFKIKNTVLKNRVVFPPTYTCMGVDSEEAFEYYTVRAKGGAALVIVEGTGVESFKNSGFVKKLSRLAKSIKEAGAAAVLQLTAPSSINGENVWASERPDARAITTEEIKNIIKFFGEAAKLSCEAGFDGIDIHGAHGYFFNKFFSPLHNRRTDEYGGSVENRMRLGLDVVAAIRKAVPEDFLVFYRHSPLEGVEGGYTLEESLAFAKKLEAVGVDVMDVSPGKGPKGEPAEYAVHFKKILNIPVMTVNGFNNAKNAEGALVDNKCDLVGVGRGIIADPQWPDKVRNGQEDRIRKCIDCNKGCYGNIGEGKPVNCVLNRIKRD